MNILTDKLPTKVKTLVGDLPIKTSYKDWVQFELELTSQTSQTEKINTLLSMVGNPPISNEQEFQSVLEGIYWFYGCGAEKNDGNSKRIFSFDKDQFMVYVDFIHYYKIDLSDKDMHWWHFKQLLLELPDESKTKKVMMYRSVPINSKLSAEQKRFYMKMKSLYSLNEKMKDKPKTFGAILARGMKFM